MLRSLHDRATGARRRASGDGGGGGGSPRDGNHFNASDLLAPRLRVVRHLEGHEGCVNAVSFAAGGDRLITGGDDMTVRVWRSELGSAWSADEDDSGGVGVGQRSSSSSESNRKQIAVIRTPHRSNVFQAFVVDGDDALLTCAADGEVRTLSIPRAHRDRLFPSSSSSSPQLPLPPSSSPSATASIESRCLFRHSGRAHKMALVPGSPNEFATCGEDGVVATFDLRERGRALGDGGSEDDNGDDHDARCPITAAVGPDALAAAARCPGRARAPLPQTNERPRTRAAAASAAAVAGATGTGGRWRRGGGGDRVDVSLYSVSFDPLRPWLLAVGGEASYERGVGEELPLSVVLDRRMLSPPPAEAFRRGGGGAATGRPAGGGGRGGQGGRGGRGAGSMATAATGRRRNEEGDEGGAHEEQQEQQHDDSTSSEDELAGTIFARGSIFAELLGSIGGSLSGLRGVGARGTLRESRLPRRCAAVVQGSALPAHLGTFLTSTSDAAIRHSSSAKRYARKNARGASITGVAFEPGGRGSLLVTVNTESSVYSVPAAIARGEASAGDAAASEGEDDDDGMRSSSGEEEESDSGDEGSDDGGGVGGRRRRRQLRRQLQRRRNGRDGAPAPPSSSWFHCRDVIDDNALPDPDGCRRYSFTSSTLSGSASYRNDCTIKAAGFAGGELVVAGSDGGRLFAFDARTSRLRARVRTDSQVSNAFAENPCAPLHLACVGIDDSVKLLAPVGERRSGSFDDDESDDVDFEEGGEEGDEEESSSSSDDSGSSSDDGESSEDGESSDDDESDDGGGELREFQQPTITFGPSSPPPLP